MHVSSYKAPEVSRAGKQPLRLSESAQRKPVLFSRLPPARVPRVATHPFSYPDPLADSTTDPIALRVKQFRRLQTETIAFELRRRRPTSYPDTGPKIRPVSAGVQRRPAPPSPPKPRPTSARPMRPRSSRKGRKNDSPLKKN